MFPLFLTDIGLQLPQASKPVPRSSNFPHRQNMLKSRRVRFQVIKPGVQKQWMYIPSPKFLGIIQIRNPYSADSDTSITDGVEEKFEFLCTGVLISP